MSSENSKNSIKMSDLLRKASSFLVDVLDSVIKAFIIILILTTFCFKICTVVGSSMDQTLADGERLIITDVFYTPKENDIIVFHHLDPLNEPVVKRVIATGGTWLKIDYDNALLYRSNDDVFDESDVVDESSYIYLSGGKYNAKGSLTVYVPEGYVFVMGDNRNGSIDSRSSAIGVIDERSILGKVVLRITPEKFGPVN